MEQILNELYYMIDSWADRQHMDDSEAKRLAAQRFALEEEIIHRIGTDGQEMLGNLTDLNVQLADIHNKALFEAAMSLGARVAQPRRKS